MSKLNPKTTASVDAIASITEATMSSREIARITNKKHAHILRDCDVLNESYVKLSLTKIGSCNYTSKNGQQYREYLLTRIQCFDLITGYDTELRIKVNRRWEELEANQLPPSLPAPIVQECDTDSELITITMSRLEYNVSELIKNKDNYTFNQFMCRFQDLFKLFGFKAKALCCLIEKHEEHLISKIY